MALHEDPQPTSVLVDWTCRTLTFLVKPADRPWWYCDSPVGFPIYWQDVCKCKFLTNLKQYPTSDGLAFYWIGQCARCESIIWTSKKKQ